MTGVLLKGLGQLACEPLLAPLLHLPRICCDFSPCLTTTRASSPVQPLGAYFIFSGEKRPEVKAENPDIKVKTLNSV